MLVFCQTLVPLSNIDDLVVIRTPSRPADTDSAYAQTTRRMATLASQFSWFLMLEVHRRLRRIVTESEKLGFCEIGSLVVYAPTKYPAALSYCVA